MYAIRSYYVVFSAASGEPEESGVDIETLTAELAEMGSLNVLVAEDNPVNQHMIQSRITSYNVCYTKLLREFRRSEARFRSLFMHCPVSLWVEDYSAAKAFCDDLIAKGAGDP